VKLLGGHGLDVRVLWVFAPLRVVGSGVWRFAYDCVAVGYWILNISVSVRSLYVWDARVSG